MINTPNSPIITLTTDFGTVDGYVAAIKGVLLSRLPSATIVDFSHELPPGDIGAGAELLRRTARFYPGDAVHVVVVDRGVGSERRILAVDHEAGRFVGPDNGVLEHFLTASTVVSIDRPDLYLRGPGETFHGRDRMAPVAAAWVGGVEPTQLGQVCADPVRLPPLHLERSPDRVEGSVVHLDRFGNAVTNIPWKWLDAMPEKICAWIGDQAVCRRVTHYAQLPDDRPGFLCGSDGCLELAMNQHSLAAAWGLQRGTKVVLRTGGREPDQVTGS